MSKSEFDKEPWWVSSVAALRNTLVDPVYDKVRRIVVREFYQAQIDFSRRQWPWHLRVPNVSFLEKQQHLFYENLFGLMAHVALIDGEVNTAELRAVQNFATDDLRLSARQAIDAIAYFRSARHGSISFETYVDRLYTLFRFNRRVRQYILDTMIELAGADRSITAAEEQLLRSLCKPLRLPNGTFDELRATYEHENTLRAKLAAFEASFAEEDSAQEDRQRHASVGEEAPLFASRHYRVLGCEEHDSLSVIKKKYRKLVLKHHPDRLAAQGLPDELYDTAVQRFREIQQAYEHIQEERGVS